MVEPLKVGEKHGIYWVEQGHLAAGSHPSWLSGGSLAAFVDSLIQAGFDSFVDLTQEGDGYFGEYDQLLANSESGSQAGPSYARFPIPDMQVPSAQLMADVLAHIEAEIAAGRRVYLHCLAGLGRTGTVVGCYLSGHGYPGRLALERLNQMRQEQGEIGQSPEVRAQRRFVEAWHTRDS
jgi:hypothetical protein